MTMSSRLALEALTIGGIMAVLMALVAALAPGALRGGTAAGLTGFALGAGFHLAMEATGLNRSYCMSGHACTQ